MMKTMDYCSWWFEGWWSDCCKAHDEAYLAQIGKAAADAGLFECVAALPAPFGFDVLSWLAGAVMFVGVTVGGKRFYRRAGRTR